MICPLEERARIHVRNPSAPLIGLLKPQRAVTLSYRGGL